MLTLLQKFELGHDYTEHEVNAIPCELAYIWRPVYSAPRLIESGW
jgi:hypothetical protein